MKAEFGLSYTHMYIKDVEINKNCQHTSKDISQAQKSSLKQGQMMMYRA